MIRVLFLLLIVMSSAAFAQTEKKAEAIKFAEVGTATNSFLKKKIDSFFAEFYNKNTSAQGYIINYGTNLQIAKRENQFRTLMGRVEQEFRLTLVRGGKSDTGKIKTVMWIIPLGAELPNPDTDNSNQTKLTQPRTFSAIKLEEFGEVSDHYFYDIFNLFFEKVKKEKTANGYIVIHGTETETEALEKRIRNLEFFQFYNSDRVIFLKKSATKPQATIALWVVPQDVEFSEETDIK